MTSSLPVYYWSVGGVSLSPPSCSVCFLHILVEEIVSAGPQCAFKVNEKNEHQTNESIYHGLDHNLTVLCCSIFLTLSISGCCRSNCTISAWPPPAAKCKGELSWPFKRLGLQFPFSNRSFVASTFPCL